MGQANETLSRMLLRTLEEHGEYIWFATFSLDSIQLPPAFRGLFGSEEWNVIDGDVEGNERWAAPGGGSGKSVGACPVRPRFWRKWLRGAR